MRVDSRYHPYAVNFPLRVFVLVMSAIFAVEGAIMLAMPALPAWTRAPIVASLLDATMLTLVTAPAMWWWTVVPIRRLYEARGELLHRLFHAQDEERTRIARDLHDEVGQQLTTVLIGLKTVELATDVETAKSRARALREITAAAHDEVRRLARGLRPGVLEELGLAAAVARVCEEFEQTHANEIRLDIATDACLGLSPEIETSLYRILQESLTNVARHAGATQVRVSLHRSGNSITMSVADNGRGFSPAIGVEPSANAGTLGLACICERAWMVGGDCAIQSEVGQGTIVKVSIPVMA